MPIDNLISHANRSGVSFYTIDTRGLNMEDPSMQALAMQRRTAAESSAQRVDPINGHFEDDDIELTAVASPQLAMRELAESTGGFAVTNTNEISLPMQRMMEDIRSHYELAYSPTSTNYDGHFRKIEVKISRPKTTVQTRSGYYAVPDLNGEPLQPFELLALNAMNAEPAPLAFPYQVSAMKFRPEENAVEYEVTFEVPLAGIKAVSDKKTGELQVRAALVAFIHDSTGEIVKKVSRELVRNVPAADAALLQSDRILYAEPVELQSGTLRDRHRGHGRADRQNVSEARLGFRRPREESIFKLARVGAPFRSSDRAAQSAEPFRTGKWPGYADAGGFGSAWKPRESLLRCLSAEG